MSRRKSPDPLSGNTRQMLDELDVLMEKMLALPVNQIEGNIETPSQPAAVTPPPAARNLPEPRAQAGSRPATRTESGNAQILVGSLSILHGPTTHDAIPSPKSSTRDARAVAVAAAPLHEDAEHGAHGGSETASEHLPPLSSLTSAVGEAGVPLARRFSLRLSLRFRPLLWLNQSFDVLTQRLGLPGSWLRHANGRAFLGVLGLSLLAAALTWWLKETLGWTWLWESVE